MKFAHLSDFHFTLSDHNDSPLRDNLVGAITRVINDLKLIEKELDFISITGDLTEDGDVPSYKALKEFFNELNVPILLVPGNHDLRLPFSQVLDVQSSDSASEKLDYYTSFGAVQVLGLDTVIEGETTGALSDLQLSSLRKNLSSSIYTDTIISMHHPPFNIGHSEFDPMAKLVGSEKMGEIVAQANSQVTILCGHVHRPYQAYWNRAICFISGGPSFQMGSGFCFGHEKLIPIDEPFAYFVHSIDKAGDHLIGTRYVNLGPAYTSDAVSNGCTS